MIRPTLTPAIAFLIPIAVFLVVVSMDTRRLCILTANALCIARSIVVGPDLIRVVLLTDVRSLMLVPRPTLHVSQVVFAVDDDVFRIWFEHADGLRCRMVLFGYAVYVLNKAP